MSAAVKEIIVRVGSEEAPAQRFVGRTAWALRNLIDAGQSGCTPITHPGPRWSDYVFKLRKAGVPVQTIDERHGGAYPGRHARYELTAPVVVIEEKRA